MMASFFLICAALCFSAAPAAATDTPLAPVPIPVKIADLELQGQKLKLAYRELNPPGSEGKSPIVLLHGKLQSGHYWEATMHFLASKGYRVIAPDHAGFGASSRADLQMSFAELAHATSRLLEQIGVKHFGLVGHSMGGMLAARFSLMYPEKVERLLLVGPSGLEDYRLSHRHAPLDLVLSREKRLTRNRLREIFKSFYFRWRDEYEVFVTDQWQRYEQENRTLTELISAKAYQMVYDQPVVYELSMLKMPVTFLIGKEDKIRLNKEDLISDTKPGKDNAGLAEIARRSLKGAKLVIFEGVGHTPHLEDPTRFREVLMGFLRKN